MPDKSSPPETIKPWRPVFDNDSSDWYFWNVETNETTWDNPADEKPESSQDDAAQTLQDKEPAKNDTESNSSPSIEQNSNISDKNSKPISKELPNAHVKYENYTVQAQFNRRTGKFESAPNASSSSNHNEAIKPIQRVDNQDKYLSRYFNFSDWAEQQGLKYINGDLSKDTKRKKPTKSEMKRYREKKKQKKKEKQKWLFED